MASAPQKPMKYAHQKLPNEIFFLIYDYIIPQHETLSLVSPSTTHDAGPKRQQFFRSQSVFLGPRDSSGRQLGPYCYNAKSTVKTSLYLAAVSRSSREHVVARIYGTNTFRIRGACDLDFWVDFLTVESLHTIKDVRLDWLIRSLAGGKQRSMHEFYTSRLRCLQDLQTWGVRLESDYVVTGDSFPRQNCEVATLAEIRKNSKLRYICFEQRRPRQHGSYEVTFISDLNLLPAPKTVTIRSSRESVDVELERHIFDIDRVLDAHAKGFPIEGDSSKRKAIIRLRLL